MLSRKLQSGTKMTATGHFRARRSTECRLNILSCSLRLGQVFFEIFRHECWRFLYGGILKVQNMYPSQTTHMFVHGFLRLHPKTLYIFRKCNNEDSTARISYHFRKRLNNNCQTTIVPVMPYPRRVLLQVILLGKHKITLITFKSIVHIAF